MFKLLESLNAGPFDILHKDCAYTFSILDDTAFVRGMRGSGAETIDAFNLNLLGEDVKCSIKKLKVRKDRSPANMHFDLHKSLDNWFKKNYGFKARSEALFVSLADKDGFVTANIYGDTYLIYPIGEYNYIYSKKYADLWNSVDIIDPYSDDEYIDIFMKRGNYVFNKNINDAEDAEIMIDCDEYYAVEITYLDGGNVRYTNPLWQELIKAINKN